MSSEILPKGGKGQGSRHQKHTVRDAIDELNKLTPYIEEHETYLDIIDAHKRILDIEQKLEIKISKVLKILLTLNGSVTRALQSIQTSETSRISIKTQTQVILGLSEGMVPEVIFKALDIPEGSAINYRKVVLHNGDESLVEAVSLTPLCRLKEEFQEDMLRADLPIGFLLEKYKLEIFRKIVMIDLVVSEKALARTFNLDVGHRVPFRIYNIIHDDEILMKIFEFYNPRL